MPMAPSPSNRPTKPDLEPAQIYPVFAPKPGEEAPWRWDDDGSGEDVPPNVEPLDVPKWNPRTGFMRTAAELAEAEQRQQPSSSAAASAATHSSPSSPAAPQAPVQPAAAAYAVAAAAAASPEVSLTTPAVVAGEALPAVSRNAVLSSAVGTGFWMTVLALVVRNFAALGASSALGTDPMAVGALLRWPLGLEGVSDVALALGAAAAVTGARLQLMRVWPELRDATNRSNAQVLTPLSWPDIALVALVSGVPEELLFRGAIIPATLPDWRGVLISGAVFGLLHQNGGRNLAFAAWAGAVGSLYGAVYLISANVWVPAAAHVMANMGAAFIYKSGAAQQLEEEAKD